MTERKRGIVDPWRVEAPLRPAAREARLDLEDVDRDADLAIPDKQIIRSAHVSFIVTSVNAATPRGALDVFATCVEEARRVKNVAMALSGAGVGVRVGPRTWNVPAAGAPASTLTGMTAVVFFAGKTLDIGMRELARVLRMPEAAGTCRKYGIVVMTNT